MVVSDTVMKLTIKRSFHTIEITYSIREKGVRICQIGIQLR